MDGFAVRAKDLSQLPARLAVIETIAAGAVVSAELQAGQAVAIMTGAPLPGGADSVIRKEDTDGGEQKVEITADYVRQRVGDLARNEDLSRYIL